LVCVADMLKAFPCATPSALRLLLMSEQQTDQLSQLMAPFAIGVLEATDEDLFEEQEEHSESHLLPKQKKSVLLNVSNDAKTLAGFYESVRGLKEFKKIKILWGTMSGTRDFVRTLGLFHCIVALLDCRVTQKGLFTGYIAGKYWKVGKSYKTGEKDDKGKSIKVVVYTNKDISDDMLANRRKWSLPSRLSSWMALTTCGGRASNWASCAATARAER